MPVKVYKRLRLFMICRNPVSDYLRSVVLAFHELCTAVSALIVFCRIKLHMISLITYRAYFSVRQTLYDGILIHYDVNDPIDFSAGRPEDPLKRFSLRDRSGESVQYKALLAVRLCQTGGCVLRG